MHPLTVTWAPNVWTEIGFRNYSALIEAGFDNILGRPGGTVNRRLVRLAFEHFGDPFLPFIYGVKAFPIRTAIKYGIPLIMYAEDGEAEYGGSTKNANRSTIDVSEDTIAYYFSNYPPEHWIEYGVTESELQAYQMPAESEIKQAGLDYRHYAYFKKWIPQENYYYATEHTGFKANPVRSEGTYSKYASLDDKLDGIHYYLMFIKFGIGRATSDASHEIRDGHLTREEGVALVRKYDGEFPQENFSVFLDYVGMTIEEFWEVVDRYRSPHIWERDGGDWRLRKSVS
jgi:N-acetyl sugar amidotransferase